MKIVLAFDSWKGSLSAPEVCAAAAAGLRRLNPSPEIISCPMSDGGEGFLETIAQAAGGEVRSYPVTGPLGKPINAEILFLKNGKQAVIESALVCGLHLIPSSLRNPGRIKTVGLGELIRRAVDAGAEEVVLGLGGSGSNDGGIGLLSGLGWKFLDSKGAPVEPCGDALEGIASIHAPEQSLPVSVTAACDVTNPLFGETGAAFVYSPQKGASPEDVIRLDAGLRHFADVSRTALSADFSGTAGSGAAGGLGFALLAFLRARFRPGADLAIELTGLRKHLQGADLCFTGEGRTDEQTASGKLPAAVGTCCQEQNIPCVCLSGSLGEKADAVYASGITSVFSVIQTPCTLQEAISSSPAALADSAEAVARLIKQVQPE